MAIKKKSHEKLDDTNIKRVIESLSSKTPVTKKEACEMLNISYNTTRLSKIIEGFKEDQDYRKSRMNKNRGKSASSEEIKQMIEKYLDGQTITDIGKAMFRSPAFIKGNLDRIGVPTRVAEGEKFIVPDECVKYEFEEGEWVWFNKNHPDTKGGHAGRIVENLGTSENREGNAYKIHYWVPIEWKEGMWITWWPGIKRFRGWTTALSYELASIQHLVDNYGLNEEKL